MLIASLLKSGLLPIDFTIFGTIIPNMVKSIHDTLTRALLRLLKPLVRVLLRNGIAYGSFAELAKKTYVDVAFESFARNGKKQTVSQASALTGLTRKETKRLHELEGPQPGGNEQRYNRAVRVISGWLNDPLFHDADGRPADLPLEGETGSFAALVKKYSGDITTQAMLAVLLAAASVEKTPQGVRLVQHAYLPGNDPGEKLAILGNDTAELVATIDHNLLAEPSARRFQRKVSNLRVRADALPAFRALSAEKAQALLEELDAWLTAHEAQASDDGDAASARYVSLGIYFFERGPDKEDDS